MKFSKIIFILIFQFLTIYQSFSCDLNNNIELQSSDRRKVEELYENLQKVYVVSNEQCIKNVQMAINHIRTRPEKDGLSGKDIATYLTENINSGNIDLNLENTLSSIGGLVSHFETKKLSINCAYPIENIANSLVHEFTHLIINQELLELGNEHKEKFKEGKSSFIEITMDPKRSLNLTEKNWENLILFAFNGIYQEISAYSIASIVVNDEYTDNRAKLLEHLNKHYILPKYKFAIGKDTFDQMVDFIIKSKDEESTAENYSQFIAYFSKTHGKSIKNAIIYWASKNN